jgi:acetate kinase
MTDKSTVLTINGGSSSVKYALFDRNEPPARLMSGRVERIGTPEARLVVAGQGDGRRVEALDHGAAARVVIDAIETSVGFAEVAVVGFRIVHGGARYSRPERVTPELVEELRRLAPRDPDHLPGEIALIDVFRSQCPGLPQVACFDTAFHHDMPRVAQIVPIPRRYEAMGVRRYGFHGISYAYMMEELSRVGGATEAGGRVILAHLGAGASLAAVRGGKSIDTSMGFTPGSGLVMATRSGDIDPGLVRILATADGLSFRTFNDMINHQSGLLGISETSADVRDLLAAQATDIRAAEAIEVFCYQAKKWIGAYAAALGGLDTLAFAGGIGENAPEIRRRICEGLGYLGIRLDPTLNDAGAPLISVDGEPAKVRVIRTDEEIMIARDAAAVVTSLA